MDIFYDLSRQFLRNQKKTYRRYILKKSPFKSRVSILLGARGVGKTTSVIQYIESQYDILSKQVLYLPVDHFLLGNMPLYRIAETFYLNGGKLLCLDEIHKYMNWPQELKSIIDTFPLLKLIISGSSALEVNKGSHDLSRRAVVSRLAGLSFREYLELHYNLELPWYSLDDVLEKHEQISREILERLAAKDLKVLPAFKEYLKVGYYPYFTEFGNDNEGFFTTLEQSIHTTIESDFLSVYPQLNGISIAKIKALLSIIAETAPFKPDLKKLKTLLDIGDERTLKLYLKYLEDGAIIHLLRRDNHGLNILEKPEKIYLHDPNQMYAISGREANRGNLRETFFICAVSPVGGVFYSQKGDFRVGRYMLEIGGVGKGFSQIKDVPFSFLALDDQEMGIGNKIPLWLFGFLY